MVQVCKILETVLQHFTAISGNSLNDLVMLGISYFPVTYITPPLISGNIDIVTSVHAALSLHPRTRSKPRLFPSSPPLAPASLSFFPSSKPLFATPAPTANPKPLSPCSKSPRFSAGRVT